MPTSASSFHFSISLLDKIVVASDLGYCGLPSVDLLDQLHFALGYPAFDIGFLRHALLHRGSDFNMCRFLTGSLQKQLLTGPFAFKHR